MNDPVAQQRAYYARSAGRYDDLHVDHENGSGHDLAMRFMTNLIGFHGFRSVLDVGSGTGRTLLALRASCPDVRTVGVEPVAELRASGHAKGLSDGELIEGDATRLQFEDGAFDVVCSFGVLHHVPNPALAVAEMLRVARRMIFISDSNNFGQGRPIARFLKQAANRLGLWPLVNYVKTRGRGYSVSEGDGVYYSYSLFNNFPMIRRACRTVHLFNTSDTTSANLYRDADHVAMAGMKG